MFMTAVPKRMCLTYQNCFGFKFELCCCARTQRCDSVFNTLLILEYIFLINSVALLGLYLTPSYIIIINPILCVYRCSFENYINNNSNNNNNLFRLIYLITRNNNHNTNIHSNAVTIRNCTNDITQG